MRASRSFCIQCGAEVSRDARFCISCGTAVQTQIPSSPPVPPALPPVNRPHQGFEFTTPKKVAAGIGGVIVLIIIAVSVASPTDDQGQALRASVCVDKTPPASLYIRNFEDYEWEDITFTANDGARTYQRHWHNWFSEAHQEGGPLTGPSFFETEDGWPLTTFAFVNNFKIQIKQPHKGTWEGTVATC